jgi:hypothetical protein
LKEVEADALAFTFSQVPWWSGKSGDYPRLIEAPQSACLIDILKRIPWFKKWSTFGVWDKFCSIIMVLAASAKTINLAMDGHGTMAMKHHGILCSTVKSLLSLFDQEQYNSAAAEHASRIKSQSHESLPHTPKDELPPQPQQPEQPHTEDEGTQFTGQAIGVFESFIDYDHPQPNLHEKQKSDVEPESTEAVEFGEYVLKDAAEDAYKDVAEDAPKDAILDVHEEVRKDVSEDVNEGAPEAEGGGDRDGFREDGQGQEIGRGKGNKLYSSQPADYNLQPDSGEQDGNPMGNEERNDQEVADSPEVRKS